MMEFKTKVELEMEISEPNKVDFDVKKQPEIKYTASIVQRNWGFCVTMMVPDQTIELEMEVYNEETDEYEDKTLQVVLENIDTDTKERMLFGDICPDKLKLRIKNLTKTNQGYTARASGVLVF